jgi:2-succinyl-5-enolpyruvyl-6-hydroxy-3-cyclohexene-1-carboxylate synthase
VFDEYFRTPHDLSFAGVAQTCALNYCQPQTKAAFDEAYQGAVREQRTTLIEVVTDSKENFDFRKQMRSAILETLEGHC